MSSKKKKRVRQQEIRNVTARRNYVISETLEAGIVLVGTEVKSIRQGKAQINDAYARVEDDELFLYRAHIDQYLYGNENNHDPVRKRKLLLHKREIQRWRAATEAGGFTIVPLRMYLKQALVKVEIALCKGKKLYDKREDIKKKTQLREAQREMSRRH